MKVEVEPHIEFFADGLRASLNLVVHADGVMVGINRVVEGPKEDVEAYHRGMLTRKEFDARQKERSRTGTPG